MRAKNKTLATWLAFLGGPLGLHRFYLHGWGDAWGWLSPVPTALGFWGLERVRALGVDDMLSWGLIPLFGLHVAGCALTAIVYGLSSRERWNTRHNPDLEPLAAAGQTNWFTIGAVCLALLMGTGILLGSITYGFQRFFEYQIEAGRQLAQ